ncbi:MAG: response regulator transcription factor [Rubrivivax sp.]
MPRLLLIDDDEHLGAPLAAYLARSGFTLEQATRPSRGVEQLERQAKAGTGFDAVILDVMLPEMDGFETCRTIRRLEGPARDVPVVMLTARGDVMDRVVGLELGADDYLPKPFEPRELLARIQTVLRRARTPAMAANAAPATTSAPAKGRLVFEGITIDLDRREVQVQGRAVELTGTEFELLVLLAGTPGKVFSRDDILTRLRGHSAEDIASRAVDILVSRLRRKLEPLPCIRTLRNAGYCFAGAPA